MGKDVQGTPSRNPAAHAARVAQSTILAGLIAIFILPLAAPSSAGAQGTTSIITSLLARAAAAQIPVVGTPSEAQGTSETPPNQTPSPAEPAATLPVSAVVQQAKKLVLRAVSAPVSAVHLTHVAAPVATSPPVSRPAPTTPAASTGVAVAAARANAPTGSSLTAASVKRAPAPHSSPTPAPAGRAHVPAPTPTPKAPTIKAMSSRAIESSSTHTTTNLQDAGSRPAHPSVGDGGVGTAPPRSPTPGGAATSTAGAVGVTAPPLLAIAFLVMAAMLAATSRLRLSGHPRRTPPFALILTRPG